MRSKSTIISGFIRSAWVMLALFLVVFSGPVKKMLEQRFNPEHTASSQVSDKKLKTWYREKRDILPLVQIATHQVPDTGLPLFLAATALFSFLLLPKRFYSRPQHTPGNFVAAVPVYLLVRKLQV